MPQIKLNNAGENTNTAFVNVVSVPGGGSSHILVQNNTGSALKFNPGVQPQIEVYLVEDTDTVANDNNNIGNGAGTLTIPKGGSLWLLENSDTINHNFGINPVSGTDGLRSTHQTAATAGKSCFFEHLDLS